MGSFARAPQDGPKLAPRWPQDGTKMTPRSLKVVPNWPQDGPKMTPRSLKVAPNWAQDGPKKAQDGPNGPQDQKTQRTPQTAHAHACFSGIATLSDPRKRREKVGIFQRPWPLGRPARAVLFFLKNTQTGLTGSNTPWARGPANFNLIPMSRVTM